MKKTIRVKILPVFQGDAIIIDCVQDNFKILVDAGTQRAYSKGIIKSEIEKTDKFDLLILTHTDEDHIGGLIKYLDDRERKKDAFNNIWFNNGEVIRTNLKKTNSSTPEILLDDALDLNLSIKQGISLENKLKSIGLDSNELICSGVIFSFKNIKITVLSPEIDDLKEFYDHWELEKKSKLEVAKADDYQKLIEDLLQNHYLEEGTLANKTSIAFILNYNEKNILMMGDAYPSVIEKNLRKLGFDENNKLNLDLVKVSHHGSKYGISPSLIKIIDCKNFVISTNGSNGLPFKECLARIVSHRNDNIRLYFNYKNEVTENIFMQQDFTNFNFEVQYLTQDNNYTIAIGE